MRCSRHLTIRGAVLLSALLLAPVACRRPPPTPEPTPPPPPPPPIEVTRPEDALRRVPPEILPPLVDDGDLAALRQAVERSRRWLARQPRERVLVFGPRRVSAEELGTAYDRLLFWLVEEPTPAELAARLTAAFDVYESVGKGQGEMLVTGYYEPVIAGSLRRTAEHAVPVYGRPPDLVDVDLGAFADDLRGRRIAGRVRGNRLEPYPDRRDLRLEGELRGREIAWVRDRIDLFFVEVQGSGALALAGGGELRIGYAGSNGRQYRSIGRLLIDEGQVAQEEMSMQAIRAWLARHPEEIDRVLDYNPSVVFFRRLDGPPVGSLGFPVTPGRTVATDHRLFPPGALGFLISEVPLAPAERAAGDAAQPATPPPLTRFVLNQDTGGAIRGAARADFFWGRGDTAALRAGLMKQPGRLLFLVPKDEVEPP